jgi:predicted chitinase
VKINEFIDVAVEEDWKSKAVTGALTLGAMVGTYQGNQQPEKPVSQSQQVTPVKKSEVNLPNLSGSKLEDLLRKKARASGIKGIELAQLLAQASHESQGFSETREKGTPEYFATRYDPHHAPRTAKNLGNTNPGDGQKYRGAGPLQVTGKYWFSQAEKDLCIPLTKNPELSSNPHTGVDLAIWYWKKKVRPSVTDFSDTQAVTRQINPGLDKLDRREQLFAKYVEAMK